MGERGPEVGVAGVAEHVRLLAPQHPQHALGGGLRPPSETSPQKSLRRQSRRSNNAHVTRGFVHSARRGPTGAERRSEERRVGKVYSSSVGTAGTTTVVKRSRSN